MNRRSVAAIALVTLAACSSSDDDTTEQASAAATAVEALNDELDRLREQFGAAAVDDFKLSAEDFIENPAEDVATELGMTFTDADCQMPASTDIGATYTCTADGSEGDRYTFTAEIDGASSFRITGFEVEG